MIHPERIRELNDRPVAPGGEYILYWMQQSQRASGNHALEFAIRQANDLKLPVLVCFGLTENYPEANLRHYAFLLEGLRDVAGDLQRRGIRFVFRRGSPYQVALDLAPDAALLVCDAGYLRIQKAWRSRVAKEAPCAVIQVESDVVIPVRAVSDKEEYAARTIRPKITRLLPHYLQPLEEAEPQKESLRLKVESLDPQDMDGLLASLNVDRSVRPSADYRGGTIEARRLLTEFVESRLKGYADGRNEPARNQVSHLSLYLHFGHISPVEVALAIRNARAGEDSAAYLEEMIVRRELSMNFCNFNPDYDKYSCLPTWAIKTLNAHARDEREYLYTLDEWESGRTHDPYWNAANREMVVSGKMHNYMRMYWGKKILEWSRTPEEAFVTALHLNNKYQIDGRDANSFAGVAWCFGKHDRPWAERPVFGTVRYMNANGLERKFDMKAYLYMVSRLE